MNYPELPDSWNARDQQAAKIDFTIAKERCRRSVASRCYAAIGTQRWQKTHTLKWR